MTEWIDRIHDIMKQIFVDTKYDFEVARKLIYKF